MSVAPLKPLHCGRRGPVLLVIADGLGLAEPGPGNALSLADTPVIDKLLASPWQVPLQAHGTAVGLPSDADMGNSEVGHNTLGAGRVFAQGAKLINQALADGRLFNDETWQQVEARGRAGGRVHFLGLLSDGNVHAHIDHLFTLLDRCAQNNIARVAVHALLDGRDVAPRSAPEYLTPLLERLEQHNRNPDFDYQLASAGGRMRITMDRYEADWAMVERGYALHAHGKGTPVTDALAEVARQYAADPDLTDQNLEPFVMADEQGKPVGAMQDGDAVVLFNFRGDRALEICRAFEQDDFKPFDRGRRPEVFFCGMLQYDGDLQIPTHYLVAPPRIDRVMGEYLCATGLKAFAVSETQKFGHVTFFWNGNRSTPLDSELEHWREIPSLDLPFDEQPAMQADAITDATLELIEGGEFMFGRINFANPDMVGHTGSIPATRQALEAVDRNLGRLIEAMRAVQGCLVFTADHGNAEQMLEQRGGKWLPRTAHSLNPVPCVVVDSHPEPTYQLRELERPGLANVAATVINLMGYAAPPDYAPSLIELPGEPERVTPLHDGFLHVRTEQARLPNERTQDYDVVRHPGAVAVLLFDAKDRVCLLRQYRVAIGGWVWEVPAGRINPGETPLAAARRELKEETGAEARDFTSLGSILSSPGFCDERLYLFMMRADALAEPAREPYEVIETHWFTREDIDRMITEQRIDDAKTIAIWYRASACV